MKKLNMAVRYVMYLCLHSAMLVFFSSPCKAQTCPSRGTTSITNNVNTYFPASSASANAGATSITLGAAGYGSTAISAGDLLLIIQKQGAVINTNNSSQYGSGGSSGSGYTTGSTLLAGNMEFVVAANSVPLTGGTLNLTYGLTHSYMNAVYGTNGQYTYQIIRVPLYDNVTISNSITVPAWNGATRGVFVMYAVDTINLNGQTIDASGKGFRGGGGKNLSGGGSGTSSDYLTLSSVAANASKGEGIAGTPKYLNNSYSSLTNNSVEGYPGGSFARGAPGNAGGGGTDGNPNGTNNQNTGGGGGGTGGVGGVGGNSWSSNIASGGKGGSVFAQASASLLVMGGGGGAGTTNDGTGTPSSGLASSGAAGGGIVILIAKGFSGTGTILANGSDANSTVANDGSGGGGAGGSILLYSQTASLNKITVKANGGAGGSNQASALDAHGPGGGGGGGVIYATSSLLSSSATGGAAGTTNKGTDNYGAGAGAAGTINQATSTSTYLNLPVSCLVLATKFLDISADRDGSGAAKVSWSVGNESQVQAYTVERSTDGSNFTAIGDVAYVYSSNIINSYTFLDNGVAAVTGTLYYRVMQKGYDGTINYSKIVSLRVEGNSASFFVYPNPARSTATVHFGLSVGGTVVLRLYDSKGSCVWSQGSEGAAGQHDLSIDRIGGLANGIYVLRLTDGQGARQVKVLVNH